MLNISLFYENVCKLLDLNSLLAMRFSALMAMETLIRLCPRSCFSVLRVFVTAGACVCVFVCVCNLGEVGAAVAFEWAAVGSGSSLGPFGLPYVGAGCAAHGEPAKAEVL